MSKLENNSIPSDKKYFNLINSILDIIVELDLELIINYINPQVYDLFGYPPEEVIGVKYTDFIHQNDVSKVLESIKQGIEKREIIATNFQIKHKEGYYIPVFAKGRVIRDKNKIKIVLVLRDTIKEKEIEQKLQGSDKRYREIIENIGDGYFETDLKGNYIYVNDYTCNYLGISRDKLLGKSFKSVLDKNTINDVFKTFNIVFDMNLPKGVFESAVIRSDGEKRNFEGTFYLKYDSYGNKIGFYGFTRDITERKKMEQELRESERKFRTIFNSIPDLFFLVSKDSTILEYSGNQEDLYLPPEEFLGKKMISVLPKDVGDLCRTAIYRTLSTKKPQNFEYTLIIGNILRYFEARHLYFDENAIAIFIRNITERKNAEEKQKLSEAKYREAYNRAELYKDLFYHDINNLLSNIKFSIDLSEKYLDKPGEEPAIKKLYALIREQFERGRKLITNVRKLSRIENLDIPLKRIEVNKVLKDTINYIQKSLQSRDISIKIESLQKEILAFANEFLVDIFENILINAVNYNENPKKEILIKISRTSKEENNYIKFEFIDNGIGISDKRKETIFQERFSKEDGSKGMGFGLTLVKKIIERYKGKIWIENRVDGDFTRGSNFVVLIPEAEE